MVRGYLSGVVPASSLGLLWVFLEAAAEPVGDRLAGQPVPETVEVRIGARVDVDPVAGDVGAQDRQQIEVRDAPVAREELEVDLREPDVEI